jgi:hypothetical protein
MGLVDLSWRLSVGVGPRNASWTLPSSLTNRVNTKIARYDATVSWLGLEHVYRIEWTETIWNWASSRAARGPDATPMQSGATCDIRPPAFGGRLRGRVGAATEGGWTGFFAMPPFTITVI